MTIAANASSAGSAACDLSSVSRVPELT